MKKNIKWFAAVLAALTLGYGAVSCGSDSKEPEWEWPDPDPDPDPEPGVEKPRFIWVDAAANFPDFANSKENILRDLTKAREAGFTDIVVDVRPTTGDVLFRTSVVDQVEWLGAWLPGGYSKVERTATWDYLQAFIDAGAIQCGYCTPGMIMAAKALLDRDPYPTREEIHAAMSGNLCRCTGYTKIEEAIVAASRVIEQYANGKEAQQ